MTSNWSLRQLFAEKENKTAERETAEHSVSLRGMIESGDFKIDLAARTVTLRGENLSLTAEEFDVLVFLAGHPQRLVTPHTMLATSWTANGLRQTEFLRVLMLWLANCCFASV
jgi:DNA-binding response OmpR family regulator